MGRQSRWPVPRPVCRATLSTNATLCPRVFYRCLPHLSYCNACGLYMRKKSKPPGQARKPGGTAVHGSSAAYGSMPLPSPLATSGGFGEGVFLLKSKFMCVRVCVCVLVGERLHLHLMFPFDRCAGGLLAPSISPAAPAAKRVPSKLSVTAVTGYDDPDGVFDPLPASSAHDTGSTASLPLDSFSALALGRKRGAEPPKQVSSASRCCAVAVNGSCKRVVVSP